MPKVNRKNTKGKHIINPLMEESTNESFDKKKYEINFDNRNSISIAILGKVSCGKSTLLNGIFVKKYAEMKMKRTTMLPFVYKETNKEILDNDSKKIYEENISKNNSIFTKEVELTKDNCKEINNFVPPIMEFINLPDDIFLDVYDIPGLDDGQTADIYFHWVKENFYKFDVIIHVVDIQSALNTEGENKILELITDCIKKEKDTNSKDIPLLTIVNKCDDMIYDNSNKTFKLEEELEEMFSQIVKTTNDILEKKNLIIKKEFIPFSAIDTFIYRMLDNNPNVELDMKLLNKFGQNELGKKWNKLSDEKKQAFISRYFSDCDIQETLEETGFNKFSSSLNSFLTIQSTYSILINRIKNELNSDEIVNKKISNNLTDIDALIKIYNNYIIKIDTIDNTFSKYISEKKLNNKYIIIDVIINHIKEWIINISDLSNESVESISRLNEYKLIFKKFNSDIIDDCVKCRINLSLNENNTEQQKCKLLRTFSLNEEIDLLKLNSLQKVYNNIQKGYSKLQNIFYINKLNSLETYDNFPTNIFTNLEKLQDNFYDNTEKNIDDINQFILNHSKGGFTQNHPIYMSYTCKNPVEMNDIIYYCEKLMEDFDYPKSKIINFLHNYLLNRYYLMQKNLVGGSANQKLKIEYNDEMNSPEKALYYNFYAYGYLLDAWLSELSSTKDISKSWKNLYIINKSYNTRNLDPFLYYNPKDILVIPFYLKSLETINDNSSDCSDYEDIKNVTDPWE